MVHVKAPTTNTTSPRKNRWVIPISILGVMVLAAAVGLFWFFGGAAPAEVDLAATASSVAADADSAASAAVYESSETAADIEGTWNVDISVGDFTVDGATTASFVGFRVEEILSSIGSTTAVGRTPAVTGSVTIDGTTLTAADLTSIVSDESRREDAIQDALNTSSTAEATFVLIDPVDLGEGAADGEAISVDANGDLSINGVTNQVEIELEAQLVDGKILVTGTTDIAFAVFDVTAPTSPMALSVEDSGIVEIQLWLSR